MNRVDRIRVSGTIVALAVLIGTGYAQAPRRAERPLVYPQAKTVDVVETLHGVEVADPYRWMEDLDSPELKSWNSIAALKISTSTGNRGELIIFRITCSMLSSGSKFPAQMRMR